MTPQRGLSTLLPGPHATMLLADLGADVVRVESASRPDLVRDMTLQIDGQSVAFSYLNREKLLACLTESQQAPGFTHPNVSSR